MSNTYSNSYGTSGQLAMTGSPVPIPIPNSSALVPGTAELHVTAGAVDVYIGPSTAAAALSTTNGYRIVANTAAVFNMKQQMYVIGASSTVSYLYEWS